MGCCGGKGGGDAGDAEEERSARSGSRRADGGGLMGGSDTDSDAAKPLLGKSLPLLAAMPAPLAVWGPQGGSAVEQPLPLPPPPVFKSWTDTEAAAPRRRRRPPPLPRPPALRRSQSAPDLEAVAEALPLRRSASAGRRRRSSVTRAGWDCYSGAPLPPQQLPVALPRRRRLSEPDAGASLKHARAGLLQRPRRPSDSGTDDSAPPRRRSAGRLRLRPVDPPLRPADLPRQHFWSAPAHVPVQTALPTWPGRVSVQRSDLPPAFSEQRWAAAACRRHQGFTLGLVPDSSGALQLCAPPRLPDHHSGRLV